MLSRDSLGLSAGDAASPLNLKGENMQWYLILKCKMKLHQLKLHSAVLCYPLGLSSLLLWGVQVFLARSICGTAGVVDAEGSVATVGCAGSDSLGLDLGTEGDCSALGTVTSFAPLESSPQCGQYLQSFKREAQLRWKRWEMLPYGRHSMKVPCCKETKTASYSFICNCLIHCGWSHSNHTHIHLVLGWIYSPSTVYTEKTYAGKLQTERSLDMFRDRTYDVLVVRQERTLTTEIMKKLVIVLGAVAVNISQYKIV